MNALSCTRCSKNLILSAMIMQNMRRHNDCVMALDFIIEQSIDMCNALQSMLYMNDYTGKLNNEFIYPPNPISKPI